LFEVMGIAFLRGRKRKRGARKLPARGRLGRYGIIHPWTAISNSARPAEGVPIQELSDEEAADPAAFAERYGFQSPFWEKSGWGTRLRQLHNTKYQGTEE
ncbi:hypothetical protein, partial [Mesorhizobium sp. B2-5-9]|uniref:hypothetical protein n=1 Tax=Mesorhizobium sp. B2-5-9 TaxID=2589921 RepID=UPI001AED9386